MKESCAHQTCVDIVSAAIHTTGSQYTICRGETACWTCKMLHDL